MNDLALRARDVDVSRAARPDSRDARDASGRVRGSKRATAVGAVKNFVAGEWIDKLKRIDVTNPFDNSLIDTVPKADAADLEKALKFYEEYNLLEKELYDAYPQNVEFKNNLAI